jgi:hypothetical protein
VEANKLTNTFYIYTKKELIFLLTIFILGFITGATLLNIYLSQRIDTLILNKNELESTVEDQKNQINKLEENLKIHKQHFINKLNISLETDLNKHTQQEISKKIRELLSGLIGQEISEVNPLLMREVINKRYIIIEKNTYQLHLIYMVIREELEIYIKVTGSKPLKED